LATIEEWSQTHHEQLETIDVKFTDLLLKAESRSAVPIDHEWSPTLDTHSLIYYYWTLKIDGLRNNINIKQKVKELEEKIPKDAIKQNLSTTNPIIQMRHARRNLINSRLQADELRDKHHTILHAKLIDERKITEAHAIQQRQNKERRRRCWRTLQILRKGSRSSGGITHVLKRSPINPNIIERIQEQQQLDPTLLNRNIDHFAQADGTPFTTDLLIDLIGLDGCSEEALKIIQGDTDPSLFLLPKYPKLLLGELRKTRTTIPLNMSIDDMCNGFQNGEKTRLHHHLGNIWVSTKPWSTHGNTT
jgi:hypothetical protein